MGFSTSKPFRNMLRDDGRFQVSGRMPDAIVEAVSTTAPAPDSAGNEPTTPMSLRDADLPSTKTPSKPQHNPQRRRLQQLNLWTKGKDNYEQNADHGFSIEELFGQYLRIYREKNAKSQTKAPTLEEFKGNLAHETTLDRKNPRLFRRANSGDAASGSAEISMQDRYRAGMSTSGRSPGCEVVATRFVEATVFFGPRLRPVWRSPLTPVVQNRIQVKQPRRRFGKYGTLFANPQTTS